MWCLHNYTHTSLTCIGSLVIHSHFFFSLCPCLIRLHVLFSLSWPGKAFNVRVKCRYKPRVCCIKHMCRCLAHKSLRTEEKSSMCVRGAQSVNSGNMELFGLWTALPAVLIYLSNPCRPFYLC